jgi:dihydropteroate synthase
LGLRLGSRDFGSEDLVVMAIVNRTPDSFYDQGSTFALPAALERIDRAVADGADIVDIGGLKAGHGEPVGIAAEIDRVVPLVAAARERHPDLVISIDTYRAEVADAACEAGADLVNDTWAGADPDVAVVAARRGVGLVCSHVGTQLPRTDPHRVGYDDVVADVVAKTTALAERAAAVGVRRDGIVIDPTHDFGKNTWHSLRLTRDLGDLVAAGWPVLVSMSRKDFVGETLDLPVHDRLPGTLAATAVAAWLGARVFRAHDVGATRRALDMVAAIRGSLPPRAPRRGLA